VKIHTKFEGKEVLISSLLYIVLRRRRLPRACRMVAWYPVDWCFVACRSINYQSVACRQVTLHSLLIQYTLPIKSFSSYTWLSVALSLSQKLFLDLLDWLITHLCIVSLCQLLQNNFFLSYLKKRQT
jgi:hypothetical protein